MAMNQITIRTTSPIVVRPQLPQQPAARAIHPNAEDPALLQQIRGKVDAVQETALLSTAVAVGTGSVGVVGALAGSTAAGVLAVASGGVIVLGGMAVATAELYRNAARLKDVPRDPANEEAGRKAISRPIAFLMRGM